MSGAKILCAVMAWTGTTSCFYTSILPQEIVYLFFSAWNSFQEKVHEFQLIFMFV
jgi:hypothetical protein